MKELPEVTPEFLAAHERLASNILKAEEDASTSEVLRPGTQILCIKPANVLSLVGEIQRLRAQLAGAEVANAMTTAALVEHSELTGHLDIVEQCRDYLAHEIVEGDACGKLQDFVDSLRVVIDQLDVQRRSRNWYEAAYQAGKAKLIESATGRMRPVYEAALRLRTITRRAEQQPTPALLNQQIIDNANAFRELFDAVDAVKE